MSFNIMLRLRQAVEAITAIAAIWAISAGVSGIWFGVACVTLSILAAQYVAAGYILWRYSEVLQAMKKEENQETKIVE